MNHTTYDDIFDRFLTKIHDLALENQMEVDTVLATEILIGYLRSAIPKFTYSIKDLSKRDDTLFQFNVCLSDREKEILAMLMVVEYMKPRIVRDELLLNRLGSKDYQHFSPGNQLKENRALMTDVANEANTLMLEYYWREVIRQ